MTVIGEIDHPAMKITLFQWNGKYIVKFEHGPLEQTFKFSEFDVVDEGDLRSLINDSFCERVLHRFEEMGQDLLKLTDN